MIAFCARLWLWPGGRWHFVTVPAEPSAELRLHAAAAGTRAGFGSIRVEARIGETGWRTSVFPQKGGLYLLPVKAEVRRKTGIVAGGMIRVTIDPA